MLYPAGISGAACAHQDHGGTVLFSPPTILQGTARSRVMDSETEAQSSCGASLSELGHGEARPDPGQPDLAVCKAPQAEGVYVQGLWAGQCGSVLDSPRIPSRGNAGQHQAVKSK